MAHLHRPFRSISALARNRSRRQKNRRFPTIIHLHFSKLIRDLTIVQHRIGSWSAADIIGIETQMHTSDDTDDATLEFYAHNAPVYTASGAGGVSRHLHKFLDLLPEGAKILDLGCGGGRDSEAMLRQGFDVTPTDGVKEVAAKAEQRLGVAVRVMRFNELDYVEEFDAVWANASLLHVPRLALPAILAAVRAALKPGGLHFASYKAGGIEGRDRFGRYFNYLSLEQMADIYRQSGSWNIIEITDYIGGGYEGGEGPWVAMTASKPNPDTTTNRPA